ncbi:MAG: DEAD/DEAH box helicase [Clostridiales bacterium]|jgi:SNF2 family DNA or RNA helicase|nr:DEAD/DEAH box helicase [Clostridiales bacterium]
MALTYRRHEEKTFKYEVWFPFDAELIERIKNRIPFAERSYNSGARHWWFSDSAFQQVCDEYRRLEEQHNRRPILTEEQQEQIIERAENRDAFDMNITRSWFANGYKPLSIHTEFLSQKRPDGYGLFFECGCGKSSTAICEFLRRKYEGRAHKMFVVVYRATLTKNWQEDVKKLFNYEIDIIDGEMKTRAKQITEAESLIAVTPFTTLRNEAIVRTILSKYDMLAVDECHIPINDKRTSLKKDENGSLQRKKTGYWGLVQLCKGIKNRLALTGTPQPNKAINAYTPLMICAPDKFPSKYTFTRRYAELDQFGNPRMYKNLNELKSYLSYYGMIARKKDYCDIPPKTEMNLYCKMSANTEKILKEAIRVQAGKEEDKLKLDDYYIKIHQMIACPSVYHNFKSDKIGTLKDYIDNDIPEEEQIIVFCSFKGAVKEIIEALGRERCACLVGGMTEKSEGVEYDNFRQGRKQILVCTIQKMGVGFNLQCARHIFMYDTAMTGADYEQGISRAHRVGQTNEVMIYNILMDIPFETNRHEMIEEQRKLWEQMSDAEHEINSQQKIRLLSQIFKKNKA